MVPLLLHVRLMKPRIAYFTFLPSKITTDTWSSGKTLTPCLDATVCRLVPMYNHIVYPQSAADLHGLPLSIVRDPRSNRGVSSLFALEAFAVRRQMVTFLFSSLPSFSLPISCLVS
jgi:hypothetical protein